MYHPQRKVQAPNLSQNEAEAKVKLSQYVYEYLCQNGMPKAAEAFKSEVQNLADLSQITLGGEGPGFLYNWFSVFWDLYSATPDRRDKSDATLEARAFVDMFHGYGSGLNGQIPSGPPPPTMNVPPHAGMDPAMMGNFYRPGQPSNVGPSSQSSPIPGYQNSYGASPRFSHPMAPRPGMPNGFVNAPPGYAADPRMMMQNRIPGNSRPINFPPNMRAIRPGYGYMDSPTTPTFPPGAMMQNGGPIPPMNMLGPNNPNYDPQMMMHPNFPMMCGDPNGSGTPISSAGPTSVPGVSGAPHSVPPANNIGGPSSVGSGHGNMPGSVDNNPQMVNTSLSNLLNGGDPELKQSPSGILSSGNGPGSQNNGPGSATGIPGGPSSVHSAGAPNSVNINNSQLQSTPQSHAAQMTPNSGADNVMLDYQQSGTDNPTGGEHDEGKEEEISKIKASLIEGYGDRSTPTYNAPMHKYLSSS